MLPAQQDPKVNRVQMAVMVQQDSKDPKVLPAQQDPKDLRV